LECLELIIRNSTRNEAKEYSLQYLHINDSIKKVRQQAKINLPKLNTISKEKDENIELKAQKLIQHQEQKTKLTTLFITTIAFLVVFIYYFLSVKNKREKIKTSYDRSANSKKLHDELANDVYQTMAFVEMQDLSYSYNKKHYSTT
jgi:hypothetical protein